MEVKRGRSRSRSQEAEMCKYTQISVSALKIPLYAHLELKGIDQKIDLIKLKSVDEKNGIQTHVVK